MNGAGHNAGGASIDGEKIDYVIAYDFIQRLENASSGPTSPVASLTSTLCFNDPTWSGKFNSAHTCEYVAEILARDVDGRMQMVSKHQKLVNMLVMNFVRHQSILQLHHQSHRRSSRQSHLLQLL